MTSSRTYDFTLPPAPEVPSWLNSLCSQIDIFKDTSLPQVFTPREQQLPEVQISGKSQDQTTNGGLGRNQHITDTNRCSENNNERFNSRGYSKPDLHLNQFSELDEDSFRPSQPWPSLRPKKSAGPWTDSKYFHDEQIHDSEDYSQPWPSCDTRKPASQSGRITESRLTRSCLTSTPLDKDRTRNLDCSAADPEDLLNNSPSYSPLETPTVPPKNSALLHRLSDLSSSRESQNDFKMPAQTFAVPKQRVDMSSSNTQGKKHNYSFKSPQNDFKNSAQTSAVHKQRTCLSSSKARQEKQNYDPRLSAFPMSSDRVSPLDISEAQLPCSTAALVQAGFTDKQENYGNSRVTSTPDAFGAGQGVGSSSVGCGYSSSATLHTGKDYNPYTPALINFSGAGGKRTKLRSVEEIPMPYRDIFTFPFFNAVQSMAFDQLLYTDSSVVVSAPTGSGKTALFELAMVRLLLSAQLPLHDIKIVYIGPMKSLCSERVDDWRQKLSPLGLQCLELTGDSDLSDFSQIHHVQLICTTPEKWDSVTRRWKDNRQLFQSICLLCIDEVHVVGDSQRGATVEAVITRMKMVQTLSAGTAAHPIRFVAVSATLPNTEDIAEWLSLPTNPASVYKLGEEYRPVKLQRVVLGYPFSEGSSDFRFDLHLTYKLHAVIDNYCAGKPTLVFCSSRKSCQQTAETLVKHRWGQSSFVIPQFRQEVTNAASRIQERKLSDLVMNGVGVHHAGLEVHDRKIVEELFRSSKLAVLISTSTLSVGVNLPAHLVVIKATHMYVMGMAREYSDQQVLQMIGRAGRPQFDTSATVVIMTKAQLKGKYESLVNGTQVIESMLHKNLTEHVNVEIVLNTITDMADAAAWLSHTLLHVRATKNPRHYGLPSGLSTQQVEKKLQDLCMTAINRLNSLQLVSVDPDTAMTSPTDRGRLMARYCLEFQTMKLLSELPLKSSLEHLMKVISSCSEFQDVQLRTSEKKTLNTLNKNKHQETIRYPMQGKIKTKQMKVNCLMQAGLGCLHFQDYSLSQDLLKIFRVGQRVTKCLMELQWLGVDYTTLLHTIQLCKAFKARLWPDSKHVSRQLEGIGPTISQALETAGLTSFQSLEAAPPQQLEMVVNRHPPFGSRVRDAVSHLPRYELIIQQAKKHAASSAQIVISVSMLNAEEVRVSSTCGPDHQIVVLVGDDDNSVVFKWRLSDRMLLSQTWNRNVHVKRAVAGPVLHVGLISLDWVGLDIQTEYQPAYTTSFHPLEARQPLAQPGTGTAQQNKSGRAAAKETKEQSAQGKQSAKNKGSKMGDKIQQQIDVMHNRLQQFQRTLPQTVEKLNHDRNASNFAGPSASNKPAAYQLSKQPPSNKTPAHQDYQASAHNIVPRLPVMMCVEEDHLTPEIDLQTVPWGDLVNDFWEEDDFDEPPNKAPRVAENQNVKESVTGSSSRTSASSASVKTSNSCVSFQSQPDIKVFGNTQNTSQMDTRGPVRVSSTSSLAVPNKQAMEALMNSAADSDASCDLNKPINSAGARRRVFLPVQSSSQCYPSGTSERSVDCANKTQMVGSERPDSAVGAENRANTTRTNDGNYHGRFGSAQQNTSTYHQVSLMKGTPCPNQSDNMSDNQPGACGVNWRSTVTSQVQGESTRNTTPSLRTTVGTRTPHFPRITNTPKPPPLQENIPPITQRYATNGVTGEGETKVADKDSNPSGSGWENLQLYHINREKPAASEQCRGVTAEEKKASEERRNVARQTGSGWEDLLLYHSNRESMVNEGDTQESSEGESLPFSEPSRFPNHQCSNPATPMLSPWQQKGLTSPMVRGVAQASSQAQEREARHPGLPGTKFVHAWQLHVPQMLGHCTTKTSDAFFSGKLCTVTTENLLEGIF
ncbi:probable ATP-dependent DNA helicase HFM1 isoform X2 [Littorina saxatilis]|uniref:probable ATP-dependent DNA helicase HFM1 isoform X2 n=1 Tax=Littorina saxatilis TaxID=31220 RepID=UPI0038B54F8C